MAMALNIRCYVNLEQEMNSMQRILSVATTTPTERDTQMDLSLPEGCSQEEPLEGSGLAVHHASHLPPVLKRISFSIALNTRVDVIGRTGVGKLSLVLALFRFLEACHGQISIDGIGISRVPVARLRNRLAITPQYPFLF
ncbi:hypothetical protein M752DRAFT_295412 [Aspergillus phoenicis ATCC 13157]|uniref:ABC transporter domain-containing protein n=1 Tax=Aspergillus phoenicis ATCC 13157 TaxID=1353007 RepID=A0A370PE89_ASPPH|nr:hypothetical protein M752DRAFT_295412 [Aspergillus phoenicis ATCC 13157]